MFFFFARWSIGIWEGETIEISPSTMMGDQFMGEDIWGQVWATLWRGSCEDCCSVSFLNLIQRALTPAIFIRFTSKMAWYSPDAVAVEDNHETQTKSWTLQWFWLGLESGLICFCICEKRPVPEYPNELGEVVLSIQLGGKWWGLRSSLPGLIPFAFVCKREKQHRLIWSTNLPMCKVHKMRQHYTIRIDSPFFGYFWSIYQCGSCWIIPISRRFPEWLIGTWLADSSDGMKSVHLESPGIASFFDVSEISQFGVGVGSFLNTREENHRTAGPALVILTWSQWLT